MQATFHYHPDSNKYNPLLLTLEPLPAEVASSRSDELKSHVTVSGSPGRKRKPWGAFTPSPFSCTGKACQALREEGILLFCRMNGQLDEANHEAHNAYKGCNTSCSAFLPKSRRAGAKLLYFISCISTWVTG